MNKKLLSEADIKEKFITPALIKSGWDEHRPLRNRGKGVTGFEGGLLWH